MGINRTRRIQNLKTAVGEEKWELVLSTGIQFNDLSASRRKTQTITRAPKDCHSPKSADRIKKNGKIPRIREGMTKG